MTRTTLYLVMTRRPPPNHDAGFWTEHRSLKDARLTADRVDGKLYRVTVTYDPETGDRRETMRLVKPRVSRRQDAAEMKPEWGSQQWAETRGDDLGESPDY